MVFSIRIDKKEKVTGTISCGKITFVDLAGSESLAKIGTDYKIYKEGV